MIITPGQLNKRAELYHQLGSLLSAGVLIFNALDMLQRNPPHRSFRQPLALLKERLGNGVTFPEALRSLGRWIPPFDCALLDAGHQSGRLDVALKLLSNYYHEKAKLLRSVISDLLYPVFMLHVAVFVFPFIAFFRDGNVIRFLLSLFVILGPIYALVSLLIFVFQSRHTEKFRPFVEKILRMMPVIGTARHSMALGRLSAALEALITAGVPIITAWRLAASASGSPAIVRAVEAWQQPLENGRLPSELIAESPEFPELFATLYYSGEVSGQLDDSAKRLHVYYSDEGTRKFRFLAKWGPQLIYFAIMGYAAYKIISFYSGYYGELDKI